MARLLVRQFSVEAAVEAVPEMEDREILVVRGGSMQKEAAEAVVQVKVMLEPLAQLAVMDVVMAEGEAQAMRVLLEE
jgi:hypothetical protein